MSTAGMDRTFDPLAGIPNVAGHPDVDQTGLDLDP
jgi:hypothetical protein